MTFVKYSTNNFFDNKGFAQMLEVTMNVRAMAVEDGVILDRDAFNRWSAAEMPMWAWQNKGYINNEYCTTVLTPDKWPDTLETPQYNLYLYCKDGGFTQLEASPSVDYLKKEAVKVIMAWQGDDNLRALFIEDTTTGEIVYTIDIDED